MTYPVQDISWYKNLELHCVSPCLQILRKSYQDSFNTCLEKVRLEKIEKNIIPKMIKEIIPNKCFFVIIKPKWENWIVNTLSCKDNASKTV